MDGEKEDYTAADMKLGPLRPTGQHVFDALNIQQVSFKELKLTQVDAQSKQSSLECPRLTVSCRVVWYLCCILWPGGENVATFTLGFYPLYAPYEIFYLCQNMGGNLPAQTDTELKTPFYFFIPL